MVCKSPERTACVIGKNESTSKVVGKDHNGIDKKEYDFKFTEDRCPFESMCDVVCGNVRGLRMMK